MWCMMNKSYRSNDAWEKPEILRLVAVYLAVEKRPGCETLTLGAPLYCLCCTKLSLIFKQFLFSRNLAHKTNPRFIYAIPSDKTCFKTKGPYMVRSRVVSNPHEKEPIRSEKKVFFSEGTIYGPFGRERVKVERETSKFHTYLGHRFWW